MKKNSDNFRESAVFDVLDILNKKNIKIYLYEPNLSSDLDEMILINDLQEFIFKSEMIIANRVTDELKIAQDKVYTRDIFEDN